MSVQRWLLVVAMSMALVAVGCGSSEPSGKDAAATATATATGDQPAAQSPVSVLGAGVAATPRNVAVNLRLRQPDGVDPPLARTAQLTLPAGIAWRGDAAPSCSAAKIDADGVDACPPASIMGTGVAIGLADTFTTTGKMTVVNGGEDTVLLATVVRNPAYVKTIVPGKITKGDDGGLRIDFRFPPDLQTIAGVPVGLQQLRLTIDRGRVLVIDRCPAAGTWRYRASVAFADGTQAAHTGTATCRDA